MKEACTHTHAHCNARKKKKKSGKKYGVEYEKCGKVLTMLLLGKYVQKDHSSTCTQTKWEEKKKKKDERTEGGKKKKKQAQWEVQLKQ